MFGSCFSCQRTFEIPPFSKRAGDDRCPDCGNELAEIDDLIAPAIVELNKKGYLTQFCCSGHLSSDDPVVRTYVVFDDAALRYVNKDWFVRNLPDSFYVSEHKPDEELGPDPRITIRLRHRQSGSKRNKLNILCRANLELLAWAENLPDLGLTAEQLAEIKDYKTQGHDFLSRMKLHDTKLENQIARGEI